MTFNFIAESTDKESFQENINTELHRRILERVESEDYIKSVLDEDTNELVESTKEEISEALNEDENIEIELRDGERFLITENEMNMIKENDAYVRFLESCDGVESLNEFFVSLDNNQE